MKTVLEIWKQKQTQTQTQPLFPSVDLGEEYNFLDFYSSKFAHIDKEVVYKFNSFIHYNCFGGDDVTSWDDLFKSFIIQNAHSWQRIYDTLTAEYDPLANYDKNSKITTTYAGKEINEEEKTGTETDTLSRTGKEKSTTSYDGSESNVHTTPAGGYIDTVETQTSPEDSGNYVPVEKSISTTAEREDTDTTSFNNRKDTTETEYTNRSDTNTKEYTDRKDTATKSFVDRVDTVEEKTAGNIGTTKSQEMASDEISLRLSKSFYPLLFSHFIKSHCYI